VAVVGIDRAAAPLMFGIGFGSLGFALLL